MQVIPHITNEIKARIRAMAGPDVDVVITEIGGTVGDIESLPFLEAARQVRHDVGRDNCFFLHVSLVPYIGPSGELKTKPTQHSVAALRSIGIAPDAVVCRADREIPDSVKRKISLMCDVDDEAVVAAVDAPSIYDIPKVLHSRGSRRLRRPPPQPAVPRRRLDALGPAARSGCTTPTRRSPSRWSASTSTCPTPTCRSPRRCAPAASTTPPGSTCAGSPPTSAQTPEGAARHLGDVDAVCVPGGFGVRGIEGKVGALQVRPRAQDPDPRAVPRPAVHGDRVRPPRRRPRPTPARRSSTPTRSQPVIATMEEQLDIVAGEGDMGGTMRLGLYPAELAPGSVVAEAYGATQVEERHRHRYEVNNKFRGDLEAAGLVFSGLSPDRELVEFVELPRDVHPYYVATQAHPELRSRPTRPHPLFSGLVAAAIERQRELRLPVDESGLRRQRARAGVRVTRSRDEPDDRGRSTLTSRPAGQPGRCSDRTRTRHDRARRRRGRFDREMVVHPGAVAIVALDDEDRVLVLAPVPAPGAARAGRAPGRLLDVAGEDRRSTPPSVSCARRACSRPTAGRRWSTCGTSPGAMHRRASTSSWPRDSRAVARAGRLRGRRTRRPSMTRPGCRWPNWSTAVLAGEVEQRPHSGGIARL